MLHLFTRALRESPALRDVLLRHAATSPRAWHPDTPTHWHHRDGLTLDAEADTLRLWNGPHPVLTIQNTTPLHTDVHDATTTAALTQHFGQIVLHALKHDPDLGDLLLTDPLEWPVTDHWDAPTPGTLRRVLHARALPFHFLASAPHDAIALPTPDAYVLHLYTGTQRLRTVQYAQGLLKHA